MSTGYTCKIEDGTITNGKDFIKLCLNAFGILVHNKDNRPTMEYQNFADIYKRDLENAKSRAEKAKQQLAFIEQFYKENKEACKESLKLSLTDELERECRHLNELIELNDRYDAVQTDIEKWEPSLQYEKIKEFCLNQISMSRCPVHWCEERIQILKERLDNIDTYVEEDYNTKVEFCKDSIRRANKDILEISKRIEKYQAYYDGIIQEIDSL